MYNYIKFLSFLESYLLDNSGNIDTPPTHHDTLDSLRSNNDVFKNMDNKSFLKIKFENRLQYITSPKANFESVSNGEQKDISFTFTFDGTFNKELFLRTTAGQVVPHNVKTLKTVDGIVWQRNGFSGEFFDNKGNRLIIGEGTKVQVLNSITSEELSKQDEEIKNQSNSYQDSGFKDLAYEALKRGLDPKIAILLYGEKIKDLSGDTRNVEIEDILTEFERVRDYYHDEYYKNSQDGYGIRKEFLAYFLNFKGYSQEDKEKIFNELGFDKELLKNFKRKEVKSYTWESMSDEEKKEILSRLSQVPEEFTKESVGTQFVPGSKKAKELFMYAANFAGFPVEWAQSESLHDLLKKESGGKVGVMNYEFKRSNAGDIYNFKDYVLQNNSLSSGKISKKLGTVSNATGLGQMLISNVDEYYPEGRNGIGKPLNEAVGMLKYISARYGNPDIANEMHGKLGYYTHPIKGKTYKGFKEGY